MAATCYVCQNGISTIPGRSRGDPEGVCQICSVLACSGHAIRDRNRARWTCVVCKVKLLCNSALLPGSGTTAYGQPPLEPREDGLFTNLDAFIDAYPSMEWVLSGVEPAIKELMGGRERSEYRTLESLTDPSTRMLAAAMVIVGELRITTQQLPDEYRAMIRERRDGR